MKSLTQKDKRILIITGICILLVLMFWAFVYFPAVTKMKSLKQEISSIEKELSGVIYEQTGGNQSFALIRSKGDQALFGKSTQAMKAQWKVPDSRPLADFAPTIILKAKDFATEITIFNAKEKGRGSPCL